MKKNINFFKINLKIFVAFLVGAIIFSGVGYVVAATIQSSDVSYTTNNDSSISNVKQAVDSLYQMSNKIENKPYYWNYNYLYYSYSSARYLSFNFGKTTMPSGIGIYGTYPSASALASAYMLEKNAELGGYIKTVITSGIYNHSACITYNGRELCIDPNYWEGGRTTEAGANTANKLKSDIQTSLMITPTCSSTDSYASCNYNGLSLSAYYTGEVFSSKNTGGSCSVDSSGIAYCQ